jgi:transposase
MPAITDSEWNIVRHLFSPAIAGKALGRPPSDPRAILAAILWIRNSHERWLHLPAEYPPQHTCYLKFLQWRKDGRLEEVERLLTAQIHLSSSARPAGV